MFHLTQHQGKTFGGLFQFSGAQAGRRVVTAVGLLAMIALGAISTARAASRADTLQSIHWVENPTDSPLPGRFGELGAYQFRSTTWAMHSQIPFSKAIERKASDEVAILHYEWLKSTLVRAGFEPSTYNIALAWNAGVNAVIRGRIPAVSRDYATRVNNLAVDLGSQQLAAK